VRLIQWNSSQIVLCLAPDKDAAIVERLKHFFDPLLSTQAPAMRRPIAWPEMLLLPVSSAQGQVRLRFKKEPFSNNSVRNL
jgi:hypothetical protein